MPVSNVASSSFFLSHDPGRRLPAACLCLLLLQTQQLPWFLPEKEPGSGEDMVTMIPICHKGFKPQKREDYIFS